jgi:predicted transcriptional regulator
MERNIMFYGVLEMGIMNTVWTLQEQNEDANISVSDVVESLSSNDIGRAYTTIKTVMDRLVSKGILVRYKNGKKFFYRSTLDRNEASKKAVDMISHQFFNGNYVQMLRFIEKECEHLLV